MKRTINITGILLCCLLLLGTACNKTPETVKPEDMLVTYLTSEAGNRVWRISKIYENGTEKPLTVDQITYTKTYTRIPGQSYIGTFTDSDGYKGKWSLPSVIILSEVINNNPTGDVKIDLTINSLTRNGMDVEYTANGKTIRTVYYAL
ncbi:hypothetical protein [Sediminibacterium ginsengisoli]|uniref:Lipocalin-like domain-containing protein n=1 Tax=Sediminibacterium ginsengisoli TaxID=413434 RepID=A0A1T4PX03_9BACT|nr:hypothetical protein [Sediminibacterium ginsengisoli]SJZ96005.1 hypothetical protein SAMN04488132_1074 [Sediminibacterium ginsengisoli]